MSCTIRIASPLRSYTAGATTLSLGGETRAGGLGSPAALYLAAAGCGTLGLLDCDRVELSNLQRQVLFDSAVIAKPKAEAGRERLASLNPEIRVVAHALELKAANVRAVLENYDLVIDGTDRLST